MLLLELLVGSSAGLAQDYREIIRFLNNRGFTYIPL
jgi:hypothetical protein